MSEDFDWLAEGLDAPADERPANNTTNRFWLKKGESRNVVFLTEPSRFVKVRQHEVWDGKSVTHVTCCQTDKVDCPLCLAAKSNKKLYRKELWIGTVIDLDGYEKEGKRQGVGRRYLYCLTAQAKGKIAEVFNTCLEENWPILNGKFKIGRSDAETSPRCGDIFTPIPTFDLKKFLDLQKTNGNEIDVTPFDLRKMEEFKPNYELCLKLAGGGSPKSSESSGSGKSDMMGEISDDEVPF